MVILITMKKQDTRCPVSGSCTIRDVKLICNIPSVCSNESCLYVYPAAIPLDSVGDEQSGKTQDHENGKRHNV